MNLATGQTAVWQMFTWVDVEGLSVMAVAAGWNS
jgi:hypothetical protein